MSKEEFMILVRTMKAVHPAMFPEMDTINIWFKMLADLNYKDAAAALGKHLSTSPYPPTVADIRSGCVVDDGMNGEEAWSLVYKAISNSGYNSVEEFGKLPPIIQKSVGSPENLRELALMPADTVNSVEKSHFLRTYEMEKKRKRESDTISPDVRARIQEMQMKALEG